MCWIGLKDNRDCWEMKYCWWLVAKSINGLNPYPLDPGLCFYNVPFLPNITNNCEIWATTFAQITGRGIITLILVQICVEYSMHSFQSHCVVSVIFFENKNIRKEDTDTGNTENNDDDDHLVKDKVKRMRFQWKKINMYYNVKEQYRMPIITCL